MRWQELFEKVEMSEKEKYKFLDFINKWYRGDYMGKNQAGPYEMWKNLSLLYPPRISGDVTLFRLVTVPIKLASKTTFTFRPAPGVTSSWCKNMSGLDYVAGIAREFEWENSHTTARIAISAVIPGRLILATPTSIKKAILDLSHGFEKYQETEHREKRADGRIYSSMKPHPDYPLGADADTKFDDIDFLRGMTYERGGWHRQHECVVETPDSVEATVVRKYRVGDKELRDGKEI